jgi:OOP family OmpA-OmpF porin
MANYVNKKINLATDNELIRNLINGGYVATYFDFDKTNPTTVSTEGY